MTARGLARECKRRPRTRCRFGPWPRRTARRAYELGGDVRWRGSCAHSASRGGSHRGAPKGRGRPRLRRRHAPGSFAGARRRDAAHRSSWLGNDGGERPGCGGIDPRERTLPTRHRGRLPPAARLPRGRKEAGPTRTPVRRRARGCLPSRAVIDRRGGRHGARVRAGDGRGLMVPRTRRHPPARSAGLRPGAGST